MPVPPPLEHDSDFTLVFDKEEGFKRVPLNEINFDEVAPAFDIEKDVRFELFTPKNPTEPQLLTLGNFTTVKNSHFNWWNPTRYKQFIKHSSMYKYPTGCRDET